MPTISDLAAQYLGTFDPEKQGKTIATYRQGLNTFIRVVGDHAELTEETYIEFLKKTKSKSAPTQSTYRSAIIGLYDFAEEIKLIPPIKLKRATKRYGKKQGERLVKPNMENVRQLINYANKLTGDLIALRDRAFILTLADSGLRISEACSLKRGDIDWLEGRALVIGKGDKEALVHFSEQSMMAMKAYLEARATLDGKSGKPLASLPVFVRHDVTATNTIKNISSKGMWKAIKQRADESGVGRRGVRIHDLRHWFVTSVYIATKGDIKAAQILARHKRIETTNRYAHLDGKIDEIYDEIFNTPGSRAAKG